MRAAAVSDQSRRLQLSGGFGDAFAAHAEHVGDQFLRHRKLVRLQAIQTQQQPAAQLLVDRVMPVADRGLRHLRDQRLRVAQQQVHGRAEPAELGLEQVGLEAVSVPGALHHRAAGRGVAAHEQRYAENALVADDGDFGRRAILHHVQQRNDAGRREVDVSQRGAGLVEHVAQLHRYQFQMGCEPVVVGCRQRVEEVILVGRVGGRCSRAPDTHLRQRWRLHCLPAGSDCSHGYILYRNRRPSVLHRTQRACGINARHRTDGFCSLEYS